MLLGLAGARRFLAGALLLMAACAGSGSPAPDTGGHAGAPGAGGEEAAGPGGAGGEGGSAGAGGPTCGDGTCDAGEGCESCAADCAPELGDPCSTGRGACARDGALVCAASGGLSCDAVAGEPSDELCNGADDDCDGTSDESIAIQACDTGQHGICGPGELRCRGGVAVCQRFSSPTGEQCNALDDDCDGARDDGCVPAEHELLLAPWIGENTATDLRPTFVWRSSGPSFRHEIEIDDSCEPGAFRGCALPSPEIAEPVTGTSFRPAAPLPVSQSAPVGARYTWRVVECSGKTCRLTASRYVDIGRQRTDFDGDGHADLLVGAPGEGKAYLFLGGDSGFSAKPDATLGDDGGAGFASMVRPAGDVDADGYADAIVGVDRGGLPGAAFVLLGGPGGLTWDRRVTIPPPQDAERFGAAVAAAGDVDGDGYADVIVGAPGELAAGRVYVYRGQPGGLELDPAASMIDPEDDPTTEFGARVGSAGDLDPLGGRADAVILAPGASARTGRIYLWPGHAMDEPAHFVMPPPNQIEIRYNRVGVALAVKRAQGTSGPRVLLGAPESTSGTMVGALVQLVSPDGGTATTQGAGGFRDDATGCGSDVSTGDLDGDAVDDTVMACANGGQGLVVWQLGDERMGAGARGGAIEGGGEGFGAAVAVLGDVDGDTRHELAVARPAGGSGGRVHVFRGAQAGPGAQASWTIENPSARVGAEFGATIAGGTR